MDSTTTFWTLLLLVFERVLALWATLHAVLFKRETQSVIGWLGLIWLTPLVGSALYYAFGINRIARKGRRIQHGIHRSGFWPLPVSEASVTELTDLPYGGRLAIAVGRITDRPLLPGNSVVPLIGGERAYPRMLEAIAAARHTIALQTYILDHDRAGREFIDALDEAHRRGVDIRVLVDDVGSQYTRPPSVVELSRRGVTTATFLPTFTLGMAAYANLRNHRKIMVIDGSLGFTGGMNIREGCRGDWEVHDRTQDIHFQLEGPVVLHLQQDFAADWAFTTGEKLRGEHWFPKIETSGEIWARGIAEGPDANLDHLRLTILAALAEAEHRVDIVTPYFLPDNAIISALKVAAMRGVRVRVVLPQENNIRMVAWAAADPIQSLLECDCEVLMTPAPFDHSKVLLVDDQWSLIGSSNWDPRSLRLNFEFNVECYGQSLNAELTSYVESKAASARQLSLAGLQDRAWPIRVRDGLARLAIPYL